MLEYDSAILLSRDLTYLSRYSIGMELAPYTRSLRNRMQVVKASLGHFPQPFLIRDVVRTGTKITTGFPYFQICRENFDEPGVATDQILSSKLLFAVINKVITSRIYSRNLSANVLLIH